MSEFEKLISMAKASDKEGHELISNLKVTIGDIRVLCRECIKGEHVIFDKCLIDHCFYNLLDDLDNDTLELAFEHYTNTKEMDKLVEICHYHSTDGDNDHLSFLIHTCGVLDMINDAKSLEMVSDILESSESYGKSGLSTLCRISNSDDFVDHVREIEKRGELLYGSLDNFDYCDSVWDKLGFLLCTRLKVKDYFAPLREISVHGDGVFSWHLARELQKKYDDILPVYLKILSTSEQQGPKMELVASCEDILSGKASLKNTENRDGSTEMYGVLGCMYESIESIQQLLSRTIIWFFDENPSYFSEKYELHRNIIDKHTPSHCNLKKSILASTRHDYLKAILYMERGLHEDAYYSLMRIPGDAKATLLLYKSLLKRNGNWEEIAQKKLLHSAELGSGEAYSIIGGIENIKKAVELGYYQACRELVKLSRETGQESVSASELADYYEKSLNTKSQIKLIKSCDKTKKKSPLSLFLSSVNNNYSSLCTGFCHIYHRGPPIQIPEWIIIPYKRLSSMMERSGKTVSIDLTSLETAYLDKQESALPIIHYIITQEIIDGVSLGTLKMAAHLGIYTFIKAALEDEPLSTRFMIWVNIGLVGFMGDNVLRHVVSCAMSPDFILPQGIETHFVYALSKQETTLPAFLKCFAQLMRMSLAGLCVERDHIGNLQEMAKQIVNGRLFDTHSIGGENCEILQSYGISVEGANPFKSSVCIDLWVHLTAGSVRELLSGALKVSLEKVDRELLTTYCIKLRQRRGLSSKLKVSIAITQHSYTREYRDTDIEMDFKSSMERHIFLSTCECSIRSVDLLIRYSSLKF